jgi:hypothetical protein
VQRSSRRREENAKSTVMTFRPRRTLREVRTELLQVPLSRSELAALDRVAKTFQISRSELVRLWIRVADASEAPPAGPLPPLQTLEEVLGEYERDFPAVG